MEGGDIARIKYTDNLIGGNRGVLVLGVSREGA